MRAAIGIAVLTIVLSLARADQQVTLSPPKAAAKRELKGRFIHITDIHPDPHYVAGASLDSSCHEDNSKKGKKLMNSNAEAGKWGTAVSDCDSPTTLVDLTFKWLKKEWKNEIDFIVWTGDSARHDNDRQRPRTPKEIFQSNKAMVERMSDAFGKKIPIVPSIGNNDIYPHNVLAPGPNSITEKFLRMWKKHIPEDERHVFERGAYYVREVIPDYLAVISLNTLFWFQSNSAVDGCKDRSSDPGALEMDWLEVQLEEFRDRGMQVWLTGHVPPHRGTYYDNCYLRYGDLALRFQDTIVGHLFGHMNIDHFFFLDVIELESNPIATDKPGKAKHLDGSGLNGTSLSDLDAFILRSEESLRLSESRLEPSVEGPFQSFSASGRAQLIDILKKDFSEMPNAEKIKLKDFAVINVSPSVIPTYFPGIRVYSYNISGITLGDDVSEINSNSESAEDDDFEVSISDILNDLKKKKREGHDHDSPKEDCSLPENEDKPHCWFNDKPRYYSKTSPSRSNKPLTPLGYTQFYIPDLNKQTKKPPKYVVEYSTFKPEFLLPTNMSGIESTQPLPVPPHMLPGYDPEFEELTIEELVELRADYDGEDEDGGDHHEDDEGNSLVALGKRKDKFLKDLKRLSPWKLKDLTIGTYVKHARDLAKGGKKWDKFQKLMFVSSEPDD